MKRKLNEADVPEATKPSESAKSHTSSFDTFASLGLDSRLLQAIQREKLTKPTLAQRKTIPLALAGKDIFARAKTGSGKTLAYVLPILHSILHHTTRNTPSKWTTGLLLVPTKELASQVEKVVKSITSLSAPQVRCENITHSEGPAVIRARLETGPDLVVATPSRANQWISNDVLKLHAVKYLVVDEADLILSYGYEDDLQVIAKALPSGVQKIMVSATMRTDIDTLSALFFSTENDSLAVVDLSAEEAAEKPTLAQYVVRSAEDEKFLLIYTIFKLKLIKGKVIVFVAEIDRAYRVKLFLEQFGIRSCVLNSEMPVNTRLRIVEEFNRGVYEIIIAADDGEVVETDESSKELQGLENEDDTVEDRIGFEQSSGPDILLAGHDERHDQIQVADAQPTALSDTKKELSNGKLRRDTKRIHKDRDYGVARGINFRNVTCVLNFDLPTTSKSYAHRIGRTARAGHTGMALSFCVPEELYRKHKPTSIPQCKDDEIVLANIKIMQAQAGAEIQQWDLDWAKLEGFRYRLADALRAVTRIAVREARVRELRSELIKSDKLKRHFEENPEDLRHLRHDTDTHVIRHQSHLRNVPDYLLPSGGKAALDQTLGSVGMRRSGENRIRKARALNKAKGRGRVAKTKRSDPLKTFNARGREKK